MRGIILAGGAGSRLHPITLGISKQLMPIYDKPMVYYPLATLILSGVRDILIITTPEDASSFRRLLGDGSNYGVNLTYAEQASPDGLAQAFLIGRHHVADQPTCLALGDNIFHGPGLGTNLREKHSSVDATIFGYWVANPSDYGVVDLDSSGRATDLVEKPVSPPSHYAVPGLYFYPGDVVSMAELLTPSARGELEITDLNRLYMKEGRLRVHVLPRGTAWLDTGTVDGLNEASNFVRTVEQRQGLRIGVPEEAAWRMGFISDGDLEARAHGLIKSGYGRYLLDLLERPDHF